MKNDIRNLFVKNIKKLPNYGGDVETLLLDCKICHGRRCTLKSSEVRKCLSVDDIKKRDLVFLLDIEKQMSMSRLVCIVQINL